MYLSCLLVDGGTNPDRPRPGRLWLRNAYRVHQRLCMAFPSNERKQVDPAFLQAYIPQDFGGTQVHTRRSRDGGFLFRVDPVTGGNPVILVQSACRPDWDYAFHNASCLLAAAPQVRSFDPAFIASQSLRFRLKVNPTKRVRDKSRDSSGEPLDRKWVGKRVPVPSQSIPEWLGSWLSRCTARKVEPGFTLASPPHCEPGWVYVNKNGNREGGQQLRSAVFEGVLLVNEPRAFLKTVCAGIGRGKAFGFGLLTLSKT